MYRSKGLKWSLWIVIMIAIMIIIRVLVFPIIFNYHGYYVFGAKGYSITEAHFKPYRWDYLVQMPEDIRIRIGSYCSKHGQNKDRRDCKISINFEESGLPGTNIWFDDKSNIKVEGIRGLSESYKINIDVEAYKGKGPWAHVYLEKGIQPPSRIRLSLPATTINGEPLEVPIITGKYKKEFFILSFP